MNEPTTVTAPSATATAASSNVLVLRNAMLLMVAQALATPLAIIINAVMARHLGPVEFGYLYLVGTYISFGFLAVDWGQSGMIPAMVSRARETAGRVLGSAVSWRLVVAPVVYLILAGACAALGYTGVVQTVLALAFLGALIASISGAFQDTIRGFERTDVAATAQVLGSLLQVLVVVPVLLLGGLLRSVLVAQAACGLVMFALIWRSLRGVGVTKLGTDRDTIKQLFHGGVPFLAFGIAMVLQPSVDAAFLARLGSPEAVGWHAAARKLIGVLATPASSLISALYPTLARLFAEDKDGFNRTTGNALVTSTILAAPLAMGCLLYPDLGVRIFSRMSYGPAEDNLRVFAPFIFLLYFSMPLGACLAAANRTKPWAAAQMLCVGVSAVLDPILVPYFQKTHGNGGLGVCFSTLASEALMVTAAIILVPKGILTRKLLKTLLLAGVGAAAMAGVAWLLRSITPFVAAPLAVVAFLVSMRVTGGLDADQLEMFQSLVVRKLRRKRA